jgi:hypothetical protein
MLLPECKPDEVFAKRPGRTRSRLLHLQSLIA